MIESMKDMSFADMFQPISTRIEKLSPTIYKELMRFEMNTKRKANERFRKIEDFIRTLGRIKKEDPRIQQLGEAYDSIV